MTAVSVYAPGHYDIYDSYGLIACQLARHLTRLGVHVNALGMGHTVMDTQPDDIRAVTSRPLRPTLGGIFLGYPTGYSKHANPLAHLGPRMALTMFESSKIPATWIEPLNGMDAVIVPSTFCRDVFKACGVTTPLHVIALGINEVYRYAERSADRPLTFLASLDRGPRKGGVVAIKAFGAAFGADMDYRLILKGRTRKNKDVTVSAVEPNIEIIARDMGEKELYQLYLQCDVLINPHKGEGFGIIPREFAATGGIALTTNWSGTADDLSEWGWALPYSLERADWEGHRYLAGQDLGEWATCDPNAVAKTLLHVAAHIDTYRYMTRYHAERVAQLYSWQRFAEQVLDVWKGVSVGDRNTASKIAA